jgi:hypothetical protein
LFVYFEFFIRVNFFEFLHSKKCKLKTYVLILHSLLFHNQSTTINMSMSAAQQRNYAVNAAEYLKAAKKGMESKAVQFQESKEYDYDQGGSSSSSDDEVQTRSKTTKKAEKRIQRIAAKQQKQYNATKKPQQCEEEPVVIEDESRNKNKKLTKRQQVLQRYADDEARGVASVLASMADVAITRSQARNQNTVAWTEKDRAAASRAAAIALEVAAEAAEAAQGKRKKEQPTPYWTRFHEKSRSSVRFQKEMGRIFECDF